MTSFNATLEPLAEMDPVPEEEAQKMRGFLGTAAAANAAQLDQVLGRTGSMGSSQMS